METDFSARAILIHEAIDQHLFDRHHLLYGERRLIFWRSFEALWPFAGMWSAACSFASLGPELFERAHLDSFRSGLLAYEQKPIESARGERSRGFESQVTPPLGPGGERYFDDNAWIALALLHQFQIERADWLLELTSSVVQFAISGWSNDPAWRFPGGIRWKEPKYSTSRNTCSNAPVAEAAVSLYSLTGDRSMLQWGTRIYQWVRESLRREDGLLADRINPAGAVQEDLWSYNQGTMIGAGVLLGITTGDNSYLDDAYLTANSALELFTLEKLMTQPAVFNAVLFRNLFLLDSHRADPRVRPLAKSYADAMWAKERDTSTGLFTGPGSSPTNNSAPMLEIYSQLAGAAPHP